VSSFRFNQGTEINMKAVRVKNATGLRIGGETHGKIYVKLDDGQVVTIPITDFKRGGRIDGKYRVLLNDGRRGIWITKKEALEPTTAGKMENENE
jgi:hypothetical protein